MMCGAIENRKKKFIGGGGVVISRIIILLDVFWWTIVHFKLKFTLFSMFTLFSILLYYEEFLILHTYK